jgi:hypothetical protein
LVKPFGRELCCGLKLIQNCQKIEKKIQKVDNKFIKSCQKMSGEEEEEEEEELEEEEEEDWYSLDQVPSSSHLSSETRCN